VMRKRWSWHDSPTISERDTAEQEVDAAAEADVVALLERIEATDGDYLNNLGLMGSLRLFAKALLILLRRP
jgi:hypothetical protein